MLKINSIVFAIYIVLNKNLMDVVTREFFVLNYEATLNSGANILLAKKHFF